MKNLRFKRLFLLSHRERRAREENLDFPVVVIRGENDVGKSHLIKSLYAAFGAEANVVNAKWRDANPIVLLEFCVNLDMYSILKVNDQIALYDKSGTIIWSGGSIVKEVAPNIGNLLDFQLQLATKAGAVIVPPPQFCFLPFYQDQDRGWDDSWSSFKGLAMLPDYRRSILDYHSGIRPREYYLAKAFKAEAARHQAELKAERAALERASKRLRTGRTDRLIAVRLDDFADRISELLQALNHANKDFESVRQEIGDLQSRRATLMEQIEVASGALHELEADFKYLAKLAPTEVACPTCHAVYENDFANRFSLIGDIDECQNLLVEAKNSLLQIDKEITSRQRTFTTIDDQRDHIEKLLSSTVDGVTLEDVIKNQSENMIDIALGDELNVIKGAINHWLEREREADFEMARLENAKRKRDILRFYSRKLDEFSEQLGVVFRDAVKKSLYPKINETGSYGTRAFLAYLFAVIHTIHEHSSSLISPIVLDTPLQQDQDKENADSILKFIRDNVPSGLQLIIGTVSLHGVHFPGHVIEPSAEFSLLNDESYNVVVDHVAPFYKQMLSIGIEGGELI